MFTSVLSRWLVDDFSNRSRALVNLSWKYKRKRSKLPEDLLQKSLKLDSLYSHSPLSVVVCPVKKIHNITVYPLLLAPPVKTG